MCHSIFHSVSDHFPLSHLPNSSFLAKAAAAPAQSAIRRRSAWLLAVASVLFLGAACSRDSVDSENEVLEETRVGEPVDSLIDIENDIRGEARIDALIGMLPGDFPADLWVYEPATVLDFAGVADDDRWVVLQARQELAIVLERFDRRLAADGWVGTGLGPKPSVYRKDSRSARIAVAEEAGEVLIRMEW